MAKHVIRISDADAVSDFASLLARVRAGTEVVIETNARPVALLHPDEPVRQTAPECIALLPRTSATIDPDFAKDAVPRSPAIANRLLPAVWD
jgi:antitoxin (DNA-binding transcriptional repressor) of toxin-antitoxin stability system